MAKIIIYDLDAKVAAALKAAVDAMGHEGIISNDGYSVLPLSQQHKPALAILDYKIPGADGFEILQRLRKVMGELPVVFASATPKFEIEMVVMDAPKIAYVDKPVNGAALKEAIESLIGVAAKAAPAAAPAPAPRPAAAIPPPGAPLGAPEPPPVFTGEPDLDGSRDDVINLD